MSGRVFLSQTDHVAWVRIHNPEKHNAVSLAMWRELGDVLRQITSETRCVVVRGEGDRAFVAGADISEFGSNRRDAAAVAAYDDAADEAMLLLASLHQPTIAMISGYCIGGGMALALSCDIRIAAASAQFAIPAARLGLGYGVPHVRRVVNAVGASHAMDIIASARRYDAVEALTMGLVTVARPCDGFEQWVADYAQRIAINAPLTIRAVKHAIRSLDGDTTAGGLAESERLATVCFASDDYAEGIAAFAQKREPVFIGQ